MAAPNMHTHASLTNRHMVGVQADTHSGTEQRHQQSGCCQTNASIVVKVMGWYPQQNAEAPLRIRHLNVVIPQQPLPTHNTRTITPNTPVTSGLSTKTLLRLARV
jgi:hypothetical protein